MRSTETTATWDANKHKVSVYPSEIAEAGALTFSENFYEVELPLTKNWWRSDAIKFDSGDVNGDGLADIILSEYRDQWQRDQFTIKVARNQGDGSFAFADEGDFRAKVLWMIDNCVHHVSPDESIDDYLQLG